MYNEKLFARFCKERNIRESTRKGYQSAIQHYLQVQKHSLEYLIEEALREEEEKIALKDRKLKKRLINFRNFLFDSKMSPNTLKTYLQKIKTVYNHFEVTIPNLPSAKYDTEYEINYLDLPTKIHIRQALEIASIDLIAVILFMSSSGTAKAETLSLTVEQFINGTSDYFRSHTLRKYHASNIGLTAEYIDALQGRSKNVIHETYIKTNPKKLKEVYVSVMDNVMINVLNEPDVINHEFTVVVNVFLSGKEYNII